MSKSILIAVGFFFSFIMGSLFTAAYLQRSQFVRTEKIAKHGEVEKAKVVAPWEAVISASELESMSHTYLLKEVQVRPEKGLPQVITPAADTVRLVAYVNETEPIKINKDFRVLKDVILLPYMSTLKTIGGPEAKARSPGTISLAPIVNMNPIIEHAMLRSEKRALKNIVHLLFANKNYVRVKSDGDIIIKEHWYSQSKIRTSWNELFNIVIPRVIVSLSKDLAEDYFIELVELQNKKTNQYQLIKFVERKFADFCLETGYAGKTSIEDLEPATWKKKVIRIRILTY